MRDYGNSIVKEISKNYDIPVFTTIVEDEKTQLSIRTNKGYIKVTVNYDKDGAYLVRVRTINGELKEGNFTLAHTVFAPLDCTQKIKNCREEHKYVNPEFVAQCVNNLVEDINAEEG